MSSTGTPTQPSRPETTTESTHVTLAPPAPLSNLRTQSEYPNSMSLQQTRYRSNSAALSPNTTANLRVPIDHFDPKGMGELRRVLTEGARVSGASTIVENGSGRLFVPADLAVDNATEKRGIVGAGEIVETSVENEKSREDEIQSQVPVDASAEDDDDTLADALQNFDEGNFDFERLLRAAVRKYAYFLFFIHSR